MKSHPMDSRIPQTVRAFRHAKVCIEGEGENFTPEQRSELRELLNRPSSEGFSRHFVGRKKGARA